MDEKKYKSTLKFWAITLIIIQGLTTVLNITVDSLNIFLFFPLFLVIIFLVLTKEEMKIGPIIGIVLSILYIISLDIISMLIGILLLLDCFKFLKYLKNK